MGNIAGLLSVLAVAGLLTLTGCGDDSSSSTDGLDGTAWELVDESLSVAVPDEAIVTISFTADEVSGSSGCNDYTGHHTEPSDGELEIGPLAATMKACGPAVSAVETAYLTLINQVTGYTIDGETLKLTGTDDTVLLEFSAT